MNVYTLSRAGDPGTWASRLLIVQLLGEVAVVKAGQIAHHWTVARLAAGDGVDGGPTLPRILRIDPTAIAGAASQVCSCRNRLLPECRLHITLPSGSLLRGSFGQRVAQRLDYSHCRL